MTSGENLGAYRVLERDPKQRFGDMQSVRLALGGAFSATTNAAKEPPPAAAAVLGVADANRPVPEPRVIRSMIPPAAGAAFTAGQAVISPDGRLIAFSARSADGRIPLWVRPLDSPEWPALDGTDGTSFPFCSPRPTPH